MRFVVMWAEGAPSVDPAHNPESRVTVGDLGRRKIQLPFYRLYLEPKHAIFQRAMSFCGPCELAEVSEDEGLSTVSSTVYPQSQ